MPEEIRITDDELDLPPLEPDEGSAPSEAPKAEDAPEEQPSGEIETPPTAQEKPKQDFIPKHRFNEVYAERMQLRRELDEMRRMMQQFQGNAPKADQPTGPAEPKRENYRSEEDYALAVVDWRAEIKAEAKANAAIEAFVKKQQEEREATERATREARVQEALEKASQKYPDFYEVVTTAQVRPSDAVLAAMEESDTPGDLAYHLSANPAEMQRLNALSPVAAAREIGKLEAKLAAGSGQPAKPKVSKAPPPISPVGTAKGNGPKNFRDDMTQEEFNEAFPVIW